MHGNSNSSFHAANINQQLQLWRLQWRPTLFRLNRLNPDKISENLGRFMLLYSGI